ncbi:3'-5' exonuclease [Xylophilus sp. GOD-11R]|uniref:3'-5' exonuclease n=1 Tax=Xylophilus sp. GOD-11R TaxID=3089814 RepID=UPI00298CFD01|nr:3'-5' exonuclease [Xylophilus sp. GOD-11R]WPB55333.1 3'-5' exonuclease [Xylophilus sp. GOD-11R]
MTAADRGPRYVPSPDLLQPTDEQRAIQTSTAPTLLIEARAGAAKTTTLALRLAEAWSRGTAPADCLVLTYTDVACDAFRRALAGIGVPDDAIQRFRIASFEAFAASILLPLEGGVAVPRRLRAEELRETVWEAVQRVDSQADERWPDALEYPSQGDAGFVAEFLDDMLRIKGTLRLEREAPDGPLSPDDAAEMGMRYMTLRCFHAYERLRAGGHPDRPLFRGPADATYDLARILARGREDGVTTASSAWPQRLRVLLVDEMHDMNEAMYSILLHLLGGRGCFFTGVGDADQVIHAAAGADAVFMKGRIDADTARRAQFLPLAASFRFGEALAGPAGRFIRKPLESGGAAKTTITVATYADEDDGAAQVLAAVRGGRKSVRDAAGLAVLLRHEHQSIAIENALIHADIPYRSIGFESYLLRSEVLLVRGLLAIATRDFASLEGRDTLLRMVQAFVLFCGTTFDEDPDQPDVTQAALMAEALRDFAGNAENLPLFLQNHVLRKAEPAAARRLRAALAVAADEAHEDRFGRFLDALDMPWFVAQALVRPERRAGALRNLAGLRALAAHYPDTRTFFKHLNDTAQRQAGMRRSAAITLASAAAVKGLEFREVLLPWMEQGEFPDAQGRPADEANLFYVAITRARQVLRLFVHARRPSEFVVRAGFGQTG